MSPQSVLAFVLTFMAYAALHSLRQGWSLSKAQIINKPQLNTTKSDLGLIDTFYLLSYSFGMMTLGNLITKVQLKYFVSIGMIIASLFYMSVAMYYQITGQFSHMAVLIFMSLNGYFQCTGWPGVVAIMGNWFDKGKTGLILGIWAINANVGNIIAEIMCNLLETQFNVQWTYNFYSTGIFTIIVAILIILLLEDKPVQKQKKLIENDTGQLASQEEENQQSILTIQGSEQQKTALQKDQKNEEKKTKPKINIFRALCFPKVPSYVIGYAMLKGCIYGLLFWLPTYLNQKSLDSQKGYIAAMVDTGSFIGGLIIGYLGDKLQYRALFLSPLLLCSSVVMFCSAYFLTDVALQYYIAMFLVGITIGGPYNIIGTVITIDLGRQTQQLGGSTASISALIQGTAAIFAAGSQFLIASVPQTLTFYIFFAECMIAAIVLFPLFLTQWKLFRQNGNKKIADNLTEEK